MPRKSVMTVVLNELRNIRVTDPDGTAAAVDRCIDLLEAEINDRPYQRGSSTSKDAASKIDVVGLELLVLQTLAANWSGLTDEQGQDRSSLEGSTYRPRRVTLAHKGLVADSGIRVKTRSGRVAALWRVSAKGWECLKNK